MGHRPHELHEDFPGKDSRIDALSMADPRFEKLVADYTELNRQVFRAETRADLMTQDAEEVLRKKRALLKDQIARMLA